MIITLAHTVIANDAALFGYFLTGGCYHSALAAGHVFCRIEGKSTRPKRACFFSIISSPMALAGIFNDDQIMTLSDICDCTHITTLPIEMHGQDGTRARCYGLLDLRRIHIERSTIDINKYRRCARIENAVCSSDEGKGSCDHLITFTNSVSE